MKLHFITIFMSFSLAAFLCATQSAEAQVPGAPQGGTTTVLNFFGTPITCVSRGVPVVFRFNYYIADIGNTNFYNAPTVIQLNPNVVMTLVNLDPRVALFAIGHECGHAFMLTGDENAADCWSAKTGVQQGWFSSADLPAMWALFQNNPGDWTHAPGPVRWSNVQQCVAQAEAQGP